MISIIVPCFNEQHIIGDFVAEINKVIHKIDSEIEIIIIDNKINIFIVEGFNIFCMLILLLTFFEVIIIVM